MPSAKKAAQDATPRHEPLAMKHAEKPHDKPARKTKVVRDSFTMPEVDYARLTELKKRCLVAGVSVKKSELLRAGLQALSAMSAEQLTAAVNALESVKTGRPAGERSAFIAENDPPSPAGTDEGLSS